MSDNANPTRFDAWFKFYPADWTGNGRLRKLSDETKAIILDLMCYAHTNEPYGTVANAALNAAVIGRSEHALRTAISQAVSAGVLRPMPEVDGMFPSLVRDRQKVVAGIASAAVRNGRSKKRSQPQGSGLRVLETQDTLKVPTEPPASKPRAPRTGLEGTPATRTFARVWSEERMGDVFKWDAAQAINANKALKKADGDLAEFERRARAMLTSRDVWVAEHADANLLNSKWNQFGVQVRPLSKSDKAMMDLEASVAFAREAYANQPKPAPRV